MKIPKPSHREVVAQFRLGLVGDLTALDLEHGELQVELQRRAEKRYRPPEATRTHQYSWRTLERWYYAARRGGAQALQPASRERGAANALTESQRELLLEMRRQHPSAPAELLLAEAVRHGVIGANDVSLSTVRRLFHRHGLVRTVVNGATRRDRRRWEAARPGLVWHADVCHVVLRTPEGKKRTLLVHGVLDDASRYFVALEAREHERDVDLLVVLCTALLKHPRPDVLYVDNGASFRANVVALLCQRLSIRLVHAAPYDPQARGKMERVWRTLRSRCADHLAPGASQHEANLALWAWLDRDYHRRPHASLLGRTPAARYRDGLPERPPVLTAAELATALEVTESRKVAGDGTFSVAGRVFEVVGGHLAGRTVAVVIDPLTDRVLRVLCDDRPVRFGACNPVHNHRRGRAAPTEATPRPTVAFDPIAALLARARKERDHD